MDNKHNHCDITDKWLDDTAYQTILKQTRMIAFEYDIVLKRQRVSPFISEYVAGNYDGRLLSDVMMEDGVIHPDDMEKASDFRKQIKAGSLGEMVLRLMTPNGEYRWFRMVTTCCAPNDGRIIVGILEDISIQMQYQELLRHRVEIDPVSGIYNRETFFKHTEKLLQVENDIPHFLVSFDIDRFKLINEMYGIQEGNKILRHIGNILRRRVLADETYGRLGNDVFGLCTGRSRPGTITLLKEIVREMKEYSLPFRFSLPAGIVPIAPDNEDSVDVLCDRSSMARLKIKGYYLRSYSFYHTAMGKQLSREHELIIHMEQALTKRQFMAYYQPQFDMQNGSMIGAEVLARWLHPTLGMISPTEFIPLFERNGFIMELDEFILDLACRTMRSWLEKGIALVPLSVNISRIHLYDGDLCSKLIALCHRYSIQRTLLILEITESAYSKRPQELFPVMDSLHQAGFIIAMDDFGSGYSSLNILKDIPVSIIKLDLRFLEKARGKEHTGRIILKNIMRLIKELRLSYIVEGVETEEQIHFLKSIGCRFAQGFYYSRPVPVEEFELMLMDEGAKATD